MGDKITIKGPSVGFSGLLAIVFIALKLTGAIHWSWLWVLSPLWVPWVLIVAVGLLVFIGFMIFGERRW